MTEHDLLVDAVPREQTASDNQMSLSDFLANRTNLVNLLIALFCWLSISFGFYLITFEIKYLPGSVFVNVLMSTAADILAKPLAFGVLSALGVKRSYLFGFCVAIIGVAMLIATEGKFESKLITGVCLFVAKLGLACTFTFNYLSLEKLFPTLFCATASGSCNFFSRLITIFAPIIAEIPPPLPNAMLLGLLMVALFSTFSLEVPTKEQLENMCRLQSDF